MYCIAQYEHMVCRVLMQQGTCGVLLCGLNSEGPLNKIEHLFLQIDQIILNLNKTTQFTYLLFTKCLIYWAEKILISLDSQTEIKNADEKIIKLSEIQPSFYQTCYHIIPVPLIACFVFKNDICNGYFSIGNSLCASVQWKVPTTFSSEKTNRIARLGIYYFWISHVVRISCMKIAKWELFQWRQKWYSRYGHGLTKIPHILFKIKHSLFKKQ